MIFQTQIKICRVSVNRRLPNPVRSERKQR